MRHNGDDWQGGGRGINPEHEVNRPDRDGDGLSDKWEQINKRDPADGRLVFEFDCGGWQTEGWESSGISGNIAGFLGDLVFALGESGSRLVKRVTAHYRGRNVVIRYPRPNRFRSVFHPPSRERTGRSHCPGPHNVSLDPSRLVSDRCLRKKHRTQS